MAMLILTHEGLTLKRIMLNKTKMRIGRKTDNDLFIDDRLASQNHAIVEMHEHADAPGGADYFIRDLDSTNHTYVNDQPITRIQLKDGDVIRIGKNTLKFDASGKLPMLDAIELDFELPVSDKSQSKTWNFSRRLRLIETE